MRTIALWSATGISAAIVAGCASRTRTVYVHDHDPPYESAVQARDVVIVEPPPRDLDEVVPAQRAGYVWINGHYRYDGKRYVWKPGYYERVPRGYARWEPGRWDRRGDGYVWIEGRWR
jgi:hypothetical protein